MNEMCWIHLEDPTETGLVGHLPANLHEIADQRLHRTRDSDDDVFTRLESHDTTCAANSPTRCTTSKPTRSGRTASGWSFLLTLRVRVRVTMGPSCHRMRTEVCLCPI